MKLYLVHHTEAFTVEQDPGRHLTPKGREQADRLGDRFRALNVLPVRILHSGRQWTKETAERIAAKLGMEGRAAAPTYSVLAGDPVEPFIAEIAAAGGDIIMCGHVDYLRRTASRLVCGDEKCKVVEFQPGAGTAVCLEGQGDEWVVVYAWRQDHAPG